MATFDITLPVWLRDVQAGVRPSEPIYVGQKLITLLPDALGCRIVDVQTSAMRYYVTLEK